MEWTDFEGPDPFETEPRGSWLFWGPLWAADPLAHTTTQKMRLCPMASKPASDMFTRDDYLSRGLSLYTGGTFLAWGRFFQGTDCTHYGSYGLNMWHACWDRLVRPSASGDLPRQTLDIRGANRVPFMLDSAGYVTGPGESKLPPPRDAVPLSSGTSYLYSSCINRHDGGVNALFFDWSVRKVGLKELWTLKWYRQYNTAGDWTKAGGVGPEDWPAWMRGFKDY